MARYRIGIDVGGTHTDVVLVDSESARYRIEKIPSTPHNPAIAVLTGVEAFIQRGVAPDSVEFFAHGTTVTTNALLEMKGARMGVLINAGMSGILEVQSQARDGWPPFDHLFAKPEPLARPRFVKEIVGRIDFSGAEIEPLDEAGLRARITELLEDGVESFAVCFLFSFMNSAHEERSAAIIREMAPGAFVSCSSKVLPRIREWPRYSTTLLNAYLAPVLARYCAGISTGLDRAGVHTQQRFLMQSNGGVMPLSADAQVNTVRTLLSGPAAGVGGVSYLLGQVQGWKNLITMDIGGTSCDVAFIEGGEPVEQDDGVIDGRVVGVPAFEITTIAAGGGSIAWMTHAGLLEVGPHSAGALPGPACYGKGGDKPTVTDANLLRGALNGDFFLGGRMKLDQAAAQRAIETQLAQAMNCDIETAAAGVVRIVNARITDAIRVEAAKRGIDLANHTLVPFGGAGPLHAAQVAEELDIPRVLVPRNPGAFSALGLLCSDVRHDYMRSELTALRSLDASHAEACFTALEDAAKTELAAEGLGEHPRQFIRALNMRYAGQGYDLRIRLGEDCAVMNAQSLKKIEARFHDEHEAVHGHAARDTEIEIVSYRLRAIAPMPKYAPPPAPPGAQYMNPQPFGVRRLTLSPGRAFDAIVWRRSELGRGWRSKGPAIIEQDDATTIVPDGWLVRCDEYDNLVLERTMA